MKMIKIPNQIRKKKMIIHKKIALYSFLFFILLLLIGCIHLNSLLESFGGEEEGYGIYTYVLFGRKIIDHEIFKQNNGQSYKRYETLLEVLVRSTMNFPSNYYSNNTPKDKINIIYIPVKKNYSREKPYIRHYNSELSMKYLSHISTFIKKNPTILNRFSISPGPFLISTIRPLSKIRIGAEPMLFVDLSTTNPAAMNEIVAAYKLKIENLTLEKPEEKIIVFKSLRLSLLNLVLNADDNIKLIKVVFTDWIKQG